MFNLFKVAKLESEIRDLNYEVNRRNENIKLLEDRIRRMELEKVDSIKADVNSSDFEIDWKNMDAFSIERMGDNNSAYTVIGYWVIVNNEKTVAEWKFYCSQEQHNKLAKEFRDGVAKKNNFAVR